MSRWFSFHLHVHSNISHTFLHTFLDTSISPIRYLSVRFTSLTHLPDQITGIHSPPQGTPPSRIIKMAATNPDSIINVQDGFHARAPIEKPIGAQNPGPRDQPLERHAVRHNFFFFLCARLQTHIFRFVFLTSFPAPPRRPSRQGANPRVPRRNSPRGHCPEERHLCSQHPAQRQCCHRRKHGDFGG